MREGRPAQQIQRQIIDHMLPVDHATMPVVGVLTQADVSYYQQGWAACFMARTACCTTPVGL